MDTEALVIGAGPGGYVAAIKLGKLGKKALLVDKDKLGGECLNYGCIPSKALIHAAGVAHKARKAAAAGLTSSIEVDGRRLQSWKAALLSGFQRGIAGLAKGNGVSVLMGSARLVSSRSAEITTPTGVETVHFQSALIVTGSQPVSLPGFDFDGKFFLSSKDALELATAPKNLLVIGGGVIGLEIGTFFAKLGSSVRVVEFMPQLLPGIDPDLVAPVAKNLERLGVKVHLNSKALRTTGEGSPRSVTLATPEGEMAVETDAVLLSVGRRPSTAGLGLEPLGVKTDSKGHIIVSDSFETSVPGLYAAGDVIGPPYLAHKASREGVLAAAVMAGGPTHPRGAVPWAVFTDPEISSVGETDAEAKARGAEILTGRFPFMALGRAQAMREPEGFVKVVADKTTHKILGTGIVGPEASDLISEAALALKLGATIEDVADTIHPHPTLPEAFQEAAEACLGQAIHILAR